MFALTANAQPAIAGYLRDGELFRPDGIHVLTITPGGISGIVAFRDPSLLGAFGLPATLEP
jgi:RNA polymerase sigma-70 factor (ECF subfamily)